MNEVKQREPVRSRIGETIDRVAYAISPRWGARRMAARRMYAIADAAADRYSRAWEAADSDRFRGHKWLTSRLSPDRNLEADLEELRTRSHDLCRNDSYAAGVVDSMVCHAVGRGIRPQSRIEAVEGMINEDQARKWNDELERAFSLWAEATSVDGSLTFYDQQKQWVRSWAEGGDVFVVESSIFNRARNAPIPLVLETMEAERCASPGGAPFESGIRLGIEYDSEGRRVAYHFRKNFPGEIGSYEYEPIAAERVCHLFDQQWPGQSRGFPWLAPVMANLKDLKDYREAEIIGAQVAACFSVFVQSSDPQAAAINATSGVSQAGQRVEEVSPGKIVYTGDGSQVTVATPNRPGGQYAPFVNSNLQGVAAGLNYPFEMLIKSYAGTTYSSGRLSLIDGRIVIGSRWQAPLINRVLKPIWRKFVREAVLFAAVSIPASLYEAAPHLFEKHEWITPGWPWIDPASEVEAARNSIEGNLSTLTDELAARGIDIEDHFRVIAREESLRKLYGIPKPGQQPAATEQPKGRPVDPGDTAGDQADRDEAREAEAAAA